MKNETPDSFPGGPWPTSRDYLMHLLTEGGCTQRAAARALHVDERSFRRWVSEGDDSRQPPWAALELLRRMIVAEELRITE